MTDTTQVLPPSPKGFIIERTDEGQKLYFDAKVGRDFASPNGGWTSDKSRATVLTQEAADTLLASTIQHMTPFCVVVEA